MTEHEKVQELHGNDRVILWQNIPLASPFAVFIEPSSACNFSCCYCPHSIGHERFTREVRPYGNMSWETFQNVLEQMCGLKETLKLVEFSGVGEPLLNPRFPEMLKATKQSQCTKHIRMITNASLLTPEIIDQLIESEVDSVRISLQGITDASYKKITKRDVSFQQIMDNLTYFYQHKGNTQLYLKNINIALTESERQEFIDRYSEIADRIYIENIIPFFNNVDYSNIIENDQEDRYHRKLQTIDVCPHCFTDLDINIYGDISVCGQVNKPIVLGNVANLTLRDAWDSQERKAFLIQQLKKERHLNEVCQKCQIPSCSLASAEDIIDDHTEYALKQMES